MATTQTQPESLGQILARGRFRGTLRVLGPGFVAAVAYVDPGNFATNISGGARYGYLLLWVIVAANLMAVIVQYLSSKAGLVTGRSLPELCRDRYMGPLRWFLWLQAEVVAMATDLAEFIGAAIALRLLFGWPPLFAGVVTAIIAMLLLGLQQRGYRGFEIAITACLAIIVAAFAWNLTVVDIVPQDLVRGLVPHLTDAGSVLLAVGIIGATVMPHVVYLHSALVTDRIPTTDPDEVRRLLHYTRMDVGLSMVIAGAVNIAMLVVAAAAFSGEAAGTVASLDEAFVASGAVLGTVAATTFAIALLASGLASSSVGTLAGQVVMQGFIDRRIPLAVRRIVTIAPALLVLAIGFEPTLVLVLSQVVLSLGIPFALIPLVHLTSSRSVMGAFVNRRSLTLAALVVTGVVVTMNAALLAIIFTAG
jgi:manganese transport protein